MNWRIFTAVFLLANAPAIAQACVNPPGEAGDQVYNTTYNVMQYCNGTHWIAMGSHDASGDGLGDHTAGQALDMGGFRIENLAPPSVSTDAANKTYVDAEDAKKVSKAGDTMTGPLTLSGAPTANPHAASKEYVDTVVASASGGGGSGIFQVLSNGSSYPTCPSGWTREFTCLSGGCFNFVFDGNILYQYSSGLFLNSTNHYICTLNSACYVSVCQKN